MNTGTGADLDEAAALFVAARPRLFDIAYRILASASEAEDVVQEAWLRWQRTDRSVVRHPTAFLATTTTRLALNVAQSAHSRRESYAGPWIQERPDPANGPEVRAERGEAVEDAVRVLLENLTPTERAAYLLREAFEYPYQEIAEVLRLTAGNARQLVRRAHAGVAGKPRRPVKAAAQRRLVRAFVSAAEAGNLAGLERVLAADVA